jgi:hypothetical protein
MARREASTTSDRGRTSSPDHQLPPGRGPGVMGDPPEEPGLGDLIRSLAYDLGTLVRQEIDLAKMEVSRTARRMAMDGVWIGAGVATAAVGALCLVLAMALGLGALLGSYWLGTLITGLVLLILGGGLAWKGARDLSRQKLVPKQTTESMKENARWAKDEADEFKQRLTQE